LTLELRIKNAWLGGRSERTAMKYFGNLMLVSALGVLCVFGAGDPQKRIRVSGEVLNENPGHKG
jgi:hypothetical protein